MITISIAVVAIFTSFISISIAVSIHTAFISISITIFTSSISISVAFSVYSIAVAESVSLLFQVKIFTQLYTLNFLHWFNSNIGLYLDWKSNPSIHLLSEDSIVLVSKFEIN